MPAVSAPLEADTSLLIDCDGWLCSEEFTRRFTITGTRVSDGTAMASIDWEAAITASRLADRQAVVGTPVAGQLLVSR